MSILYRVTVKCDFCGLLCDTVAMVNVVSIKEAIARATSNGWAVVNVSGQNKNACPTCLRKWRDIRASDRQVTTEYVDPNVEINHP